MKTLHRTAPALAVAAVVAAAWTPTPARADCTPLLVSTDNSGGVFDATEWPGGAPMDDFAAILQAINEPGLCVRLIAPMFGNWQAATSRFVTDFLVREKPEAQEVEVVTGAVYDVFSNEWLNAKGRLVPTFPGDACSNDAVGAMEHHLRQEEAAILAIGPLTDVACLASVHRKLVPRIREVVWLAGRSAEAQLPAGDPDDPLTQFPDLNYDKDPGAARVALDVLSEEGVPVRVVGGAVVLDSKVKPLVKLLQGGRETVLRTYARTLAEKITDLGLLDTDPFDSTALNALLAPQHYRCREMGYRILPCGLTAPDFLKDVCTTGDERTALWFSEEFERRGPTAFCEGFAPGGKEAVEERIRKMTY
ncbi:MAG: nucleoside hydrolase [Thermoanaerobaculia bacterium]